MTDQPWQPWVAKRIINKMASDLRCDLSYTRHAKDRIDERNLIISDIHYVLKHGIVRTDPVSSTVKGLYKYQVEGKSPNSACRFLRIVVVPDEKSLHIKVITAMWRDEN